ncbi:hypothetical protein RB623_05965 [Mesorhizobium sp. LHD-90]|uniref:DUF883 family protein n=1 Tax=Mesorhizobium sp. LHD-90 TaxID=3071414 RepID=UPI0027E19680|nr:hypothetical protein [Mesorhizobium sp. LHD-90]MDQ6433595.1 hypothetical protein [Mesorhizobium sp. LHD-90]
MAAATGKTAKSEMETPVSPDLEADIRQLREDIARLTEQLAKTGQHSYGAARRAASEGVEQLKAQGEAAMEGLKTNARDIEDQLTSAVREKPITSLAIAAGIGYFLALLSRR